jgi:hypothetical protein
LRLGPLRRRIFFAGMVAGFEEVMRKMRGTEALDGESIE